MMACVPGGARPGHTLDYCASTVTKVLPYSLPQRATQAQQQASSGLGLGLDLGLGLSMTKLDRALVQRLSLSRQYLRS